MAYAPGDNVSLAIQDMERRFIDLPQHFDTFIEERSRSNPNVLTSRFPRGQYQYFSGLEQTINIFHGTAGEQAGLANFRRMQLSRPPSGDDPGNDACGPFSSKTFEHGIEARSFTGYEGVWESPAICLSDLMYLHQGKEQARLMAKQLPVVVESIWENWTRENVLQFSVAANNAYIITKQGVDVTLNGPRYSYNPYDEKDYNDGNGPVPYVTIPAGLEVGGLDASFFDFMHDYLADECPEAALSKQSMVPIFGLVLHERDIKNMIESNDRLREAYLYGKPEQLIDGFPLMFKSLSNYAIIHDARQPRFKLVGFDASGDIEARRVLPKRYVATTSGRRQEANPEYQAAELAIGFIMINQSFGTLVPGNLPTLGDGMVFGPVKGLNGQFTWVNEWHEEKNPDREKGNYRARFRLFPRPDTFSRNLISFLYARTPHIFAGPQIRVAQTVTPEVSANLSVDAVIGDWDAASKTMQITLDGYLAITGLPAAALIVAGDATEYDAVITDSVNAPGYTVGFATDVSADIAKFTTSMVVSLV
jgi:hypothetical protein